MSVTKRIRVNAVHYGLGQLAIAAFGFLLNVVVARLLSKETFGGYTYLIALATSFTPFLNFGLHARYATQGSRERDLIGAYWVRSLIMKAGLTPFVLAGFLVTYRSLEGQFDAAAFWGIGYVLLQSLLIGTDVVFKPAEQGKMWAIRRVVYEGSLVLMFVTAIIFLGVHDVTTLFALATVGTAFGVIWASITAWRVTGVRFSIFLEQWRELRIYSELRDLLPFTVIAILWVLYFRLSAILIDKLSSPAELANFRVCFLAMNMVLYLPRAVHQASAPRLAYYHERGEAGKFKTLAHRTMDVDLFFAFMALGGGFLFGPGLLTLIFGQKYASAEPVWRIFNAALFVLAIQAYFTAGLTYTKREGRVAVQVGLSFGVQTVLNVVLIPLYGALGAAAALFMGAIILAGTNYATWHREFGPGLFQSGRIAAQAGSVIVATCAGYATLYFGLGMWVGIFIYTVVFGSLAWQFRVVPPAASALPKKLLRIGSS